MLVSVNGKRVGPAEASVSVFDRGFLFGDAIYETICTSAGVPILLDEHLERLVGSGGAIGLEVKPLLAQLREEVHGLCAEVSADQAMIRIVLTRGNSPDLDLLRAEGPPVRLVMVKALQPWDPRLIEEGVRLLSVRPEEIVGRVAPWVKSNNRQANLMAHRLARSKGFDDGLFVDPAGNISEGPTWNVFCVFSGQVSTPALEHGILPGITRSCILRLCVEERIPVREEEISLQRAHAADEIFLTSTTRGVMPVAQLDELRFGPGLGPLTVRLRDALTRLVSELSQR